MTSEAAGELVVGAVDKSPHSKTMPTPSTKPKVGEWFWIKDSSGGGRRLGCAVRIGTNYVKIECVGRHEYRVHFRDFWKECERELDPQTHIDKQSLHYKREIDRITSDIKELTATLGLAPAALPGGGEQVAALATQNGNGAVGEYKTALVKAKDVTLPALFEEIKEASASLSVWLAASMIPLKAQADDLKPLIEAVESRIFNVELYAGLVETVEQISDGAPASIGERVHLMQRRAYMDEECLADYQHGGMDFDGIKEFDAWLVKPHNRDRILPFPRCLIAFQVRRKEKEREAINIGDFIRISEEKEMDKATFLYMRNGERVYRLQTAIDFGARLFPDLGAPEVGSEKVYAEIWGESVRQIISAGAYDEMVKKEKDHETYIAHVRKTKPKKDHFSLIGNGWGYCESQKFQEFTPDSVFYDEIEKTIQADIEAHNRLVIVLQGLMDRSPVFHPHPKFSLWKGEDFKAAFELVYDDSRTFTAGEKPDFEAFRKALNEKLCVGCVTVGQEDFWELDEGRRESNRLDNDWRTKTHYRPERWTPLGNPGPGLIAQVAAYSKRTGVCRFEWERERVNRKYTSQSETLPCSLRVPAPSLLNVSAYVPGMYKQFFNDPRTRADYMKWAPLLLAAEEWHAGNKSGVPKKKRR